MTRPRGYLTDWTPRPDTQALIDAAKGVLAEYRNYLPMTCRQIFYRLVGAHGYPKTERDYARLCEALNKARRAGLIPFEHIRDDGILREEPFGYHGLPDVLKTIREHHKSYRLHRQAGQPWFTTIVCEAGGMVPQLASVADPYGIPVLSAGGFNSVTDKYNMAREIGGRSTPTRVLHIGDYDPSGVHIFRNLKDDVTAFAGRAKCRFERIAVTEEQVIDLDLPTAEAKATDNREFDGIDGDSEATAQAEAIPPDQLAQILDDAIREEWDEAIGDATLEREEHERQRLKTWLETRLPKHGRDPKAGRPWKQFPDSVHRFVRAVSEGGSVASEAQYFGIPRRTAYRILQRFGLPPPRKRDPQ